MAGCGHKLMFRSRSNRAADIVVLLPVSSPSLFANQHVGPLLSLKASVFSATHPLSPLNSIMHCLCTVMTPFSFLLKFFNGIFCSSKIKKKNKTFKITILADLKNAPKYYCLVARGFHMHMKHLMSLGH